MKFESLEAKYITPKMQKAFSLGDVDGLTRTIGPERDMVVLKGITSGGVEAWSAIDTTKLPVYGSESTIEAWALVKEIGGNFVNKDFNDPREAVKSLGYLIDHHILQAAFANLYLDAEAIQKGIPLFQLLEGTKSKVDVGVSISKTQTLEEISQKITRDKFRRIKVKVGPTIEDYEKIAQIRKNFPKTLLMIDANSSFDIRNPGHKQILINYGNLDLLMMEQPLAYNDIAQHIELQKFFNKNSIPGKVCLDESIHTMDDIHWAVEGGIPIINVKVTRVGGLDIALSMIKYCQENKVDTWIGGMVELTAPGKAHSLAMACHSGVTLPSDISGTAAYFKEGQDPCQTPMERSPEGAYIEVPQITGRGWEVDEEKMDKITNNRISFGKIGF